MLELSRKSPSAARLRESPPTGLHSGRERPSDQRDVSSRPAVPSACRALPCTLAPHAHQALAQMPPDPGGTSVTGPPPGSPVAPHLAGSRTPCLLPRPRLQGRRGAHEGRDGPPCLRGGPRAGGHKAGLLPSQHNREGRGSLAQVSSSLRSQDPASFLFPLRLPRPPDCAHTEGTSPSQAPGTSP